jgi:hypothetical protein
VQQRLHEFGASGASSIFGPDVGRDLGLADDLFDALQNAGEFPQHVSWNRG